MPPASPQIAVLSKVNILTILRLPTHSGVGCLSLHRYDVLFDSKLTEDFILSELAVHWQAGVRVRLLHFRCSSAIPTYASSSIA